MPPDADLPAPSFRWRDVPAVRNITGRMLLVRRCDTGDWELPGGHVDPGESASDAAVRETAEESCITAEVTGQAASPSRRRTRTSPSEIDASADELANPIKP